MSLCALDINMQPSRKVSQTLLQIWRHCRYRNWEMKK